MRRHGWARRPMVVTDSGLMEAGWVDELLRLLVEAGLSPVVWNEVTPNPKETSAAPGS